MRKDKDGQQVAVAGLPEVRGRTLLTLLFGLSIVVLASIVLLATSQVNHLSSTIKQLSL